MEEKVVFVPIDNRPCNLSFPKTLANSIGVELVTPPDNLLGNYNISGSCEEIINWLDSEIEKTTLFILSVDMICYGGLISSRKNEATLTQALERLKILERIKKYNPVAKIYLHNVLMRLSISVDCEEKEKIWRKIFDFSCNLNSHMFNADEQKILAEYLETRKRNHLINLKCLEYTKEGISDFTVISKEDCAKDGFHRDEQDNLLNYINTNNISSKTKILTGTDEIMSCLLTKYNLELKNENPLVAVRYSFGKGEYVSLYEDIPLSKTIEDHLNLVGLNIVTYLKDADYVFFIHSFENTQKDLFFEDLVQRDRETRHRLKNFCSEVIMMNEIDKKAFVADVFYCNGGDVEFLDYFSQMGDPKTILSYAGWNTSSNSIGAAISAAFCNAGLKQLLKNYIEDVGYQTIVRKQLIEFLKQKSISKYDLGSNLEIVQQFAEEKINQWAKEFLSKIGISNFKKVNLSFPWKRIFECDCDIIFS